MAVYTKIKKKNILSIEKICDLPEKIHEMKDVTNSVKRDK